MREYDRLQVDAPIRVGGRVVIGGGTLVMHEGEKVEIRPFSDDPAYILRIGITLSETHDNKLKGIVTAEKTLELNFFVTPSAMMSSIVSTVTPTSFAVSDDGSVDYVLSLVANVSGNTESHVTVINYTLMARELK